MLLSSPRGVGVVEFTASSPVVEVVRFTGLRRPDRPDGEGAAMNSPLPHFRSTRGG